MYFWKNELPKLFTASVYIPRGTSSCLLPLQEVLQGQQVSLTQGLINVLLLPCISEHVRFHVCPLSVGSPCPKVLWLSLKLTLLNFNTRCSYSLFPGWRNCELGSLIWALDSPFFEEILHNCHYSPISNHSSGVTILLHHPLIHVIEIPYLYF